MKARPARTRLGGDRGPRPRGRAAEGGDPPALARATPDPDRALRAIEALLRSREARGWRARPREEETLALAATIGASSETLARAAAAWPARLEAIVRGGGLDRPLDGPALAGALARRLARAAPGDHGAAQRLLRFARRRETLRIAARELTHRSDVLGAAAELSALAAAICEAALGFSLRTAEAQLGAPDRARAGFCVLAFGKLGGEELNFSSDVDLVFVYREDAETRGPRGTHRELYTRAAEIFVRALGEVTADGFCYRVDLGLRPEGRNGPLVNPAEAVRGYYESFGRSWERIALARARPLCGDLALGEALLRSLDPFVYRRSADFSVLDELRDLKARIEREAAQRGDDLKRGPGGIREIEFLGQALLLLHGGQRPELRERGLVPLLGKLEAAGLLPARDAAELADAYRFLRRAEERIQMLDERQTHLVPRDPAELELLARRLGHAAPDAAAGFSAELSRHRGAARAAFDALLRERRAAPGALEPKDARLASVTDDREPEEERIETLVRHGFVRPAQALDELRRLVRARAPFAAGSPAARLLPWLVEELSRTVDPDRALGHFAAWATALRAPATYLGLLAENRPSLRRLLALFGASDLLSREFLLRPELLDRLLPQKPPPSVKDEEELAAELASRLEGEDDPERILSLACRFRNEELLRIGLLDLSGELSVDAVGRQLSALARALVGRTLALALAETTARWGAPGAGSALSVLGMGSLGGEELSYGSDLDLVFLYEAEGETSGGARGPVPVRELFARAAQRLIALLALPTPEGSLYRIDSRLRPSGNQGALVSSLSAFRDYHETRAALWERQALLKAAHCAGAREPFERARREVVWPPDPPPIDPVAAAAEIARLRRRMEAELAEESPGRYNPKLGRGGLVDVEFTVQYLQLVHGKGHPELQTPVTSEALRALRELGLVTPAVGEALSRGHAFLRRLESHLRILLDVRQSHLPREPRALAALGRRLGFLAEGTGRGPGERLVDAYLEVTSSVREAFERVLGIEP